eukprot:scaffold1194_cov369-Prasinococcus_capsulatus_cf.AAC.13
MPLVFRADRVSLCEPLPPQWYASRTKAVVVVQRGLGCCLKFVFSLVSMPVRTAGGRAMDLRKLFQSKHIIQNIRE